MSWKKKNLNSLRKTRKTCHGACPSCAFVVVHLIILGLIALIARAPVVVVQALGPEERLEVRRRLDRVVARQAREDVVAHVRRPDVVVHPVEEAEELGVGSIDRAQRAADPRPLVVPKVGHFRRRVLEPGVQDEPEVDPHVGAPVVAGYGGESELVGTV